MRFVSAYGGQLNWPVLTISYLLGDCKEVFCHALAAGINGGLLFSPVVITFISPVFFLRMGKKNYL